MSAKSQLLDPRTRLVLLVFLSAAHAAADGPLIAVLAAISIVLVFAYPAAFRRGWYVIALTAIFLAVIASIVAAFDRSTSVTLLVLDFLRWTSLATTTVVLALTLDVLEAVTALVFFRIPLKMAIAFGVGLRFLPVVIDEVQRVFMVQRELGLRFTREAVKSYGRMGILSRMVAPMLIAIIRRVDALVISTGVQMLERRIRSHQWHPFRPLDALVIIGATGLATFSLFR